MTNDSSENFVAPAYLHLCAKLYRNLFKSENVYKDKEDTAQTVSKSIQKLQHDFGGQDNLFMNLRTDVSVSVLTTIFIYCRKLTFKRTYCAFPLCIERHRWITCWAAAPPRRVSLALILRDKLLTGKYSCQDWSIFITQSHSRVCWVASAILSYFKL